MIFFKSPIDVRSLNGKLCSWLWPTDVLCHARCFLNSWFSYQHSKFQRFYTEILKFQACPDKNERIWQHRATITTGNRSVGAGYWLSLLDGACTLGLTTICTTPYCVTCSACFCYLPAPIVIYVCDPWDTGQGLCRRIWPGDKERNHLWNRMDSNVQIKSIFNRTLIEMISTNVFYDCLAELRIQFCRWCPFQSNIHFAIRPFSDNRSQWRIRPEILIIKLWSQFLCRGKSWTVMKSYQRPQSLSSELWCWDGLPGFHILRQRDLDFITILFTSHWMRAPPRCDLGHRTIFLKAIPWELPATRSPWSRANMCLRHEGGSGGHITISSTVATFQGGLP